MLGFSPIEILVIIAPKIFWACVIIAALMIMNKFVNAYIQRTNLMK